MFLLLSYLSFLAFDVVSRSWGKPPFSFSFSFLSPNFPCFFFFCDEENKRRERLCKKRVFSRFEFLRTFYEMYGCIRAVLSTSLSRARSPVNARAWRGQGSDDVSRSRAKLVLCLGSQILNFHSRAFSQLFFCK